MKQFGVATKAIIVNERGQYLVLRKSDVEEINPNTYDIPGGRMEFGEKPEEALHREVKEETGLEVDILTIFNTWSFEKDDTFQLVGIDFLCLYKKGKEKLSREHDEFLWLSKSEVEKLDMPKWLVKTIEKAEKYKALFLDA